MAENEQEELSTEEILSSIRNILMEDNVNQEETKKAAPQEEVAAVSVEEPAELDLDEEIEDINLDDEVFDLSTNMIVDDIDDAPINLEAELIDVNNDEADIAVEDLDFNVEENVQQNNEEEIGIILDEMEIISEAPQDHVNEDNVLDEELSTLEDVVEGLEDTPDTMSPVKEEPAQEDSEDFFNEENQAEEAPELNIEDVLKQIGDAVTEAEFSITDDSDDIIIEDEPLPEEILDLDEIATVPEEAEALVERVVQMETPKVEKLQADASQELLNNFAKVFSENKKETSVSDDVISEKIQNWMENNLPAVLEKILNKKDVRVMEKTDE